MTLPTEILDLVFSQIHVKTAAPTAESQATFSSLCLSSKHFLPLAREYLYYRPLRYRTASWDKALCLLRTLSPDPTPHADLVRSLEGLVNYIAELGGFYHEDFDSTLALALPQLFKLQSSVVDFLYHVELIRVCIELHTVNITFNSTQELAQVSQALEGSSSTLKTVLFGGCDEKQEPWYNLPPDLVHSALRQSPLQNLEAVKIFELSSLATVYPRLPSINLPLKSLQIQQSFCDFDNLKGFFLTDPSSLVDFGIQVDVGRDPEILSYIFRSLPNTLQRLKISQFVHFEYRPSLKHYRQRSSSAQIPLDAFHPFSHLLHLTLNGFQDASLLLLKTLCISSPQLISLDFSQSKWVTGEGTNATTYQALAQAVFLEHEILRTLTQFKHLRFIDFGWLPTTRSEDYADLVSDLAAQGIRAKWDRCEERTSRYLDV